MKYIVTIFHRYGDTMLRAERHYIFMRFIFSEILKIPKSFQIFPSSLQYKLNDNSKTN